jgi:hypothetical protein
MARSSLWNSPFVAFVLGMTVTGLGHVYLRRWLRALGWIVVGTAVSFLFVPESAMRALVELEPVPFGEVYPAMVVTLLSAIDASIVALRVRSTDERGTTGVDDDADTPTCPHCGGEVDPELGFCHWCTREFESPARADAPADSPGSEQS